MLETLIKRNGEREVFSNEKANSWMLWAGKDVIDRMDWSSIVMEARATAPEMMSTQDWQQSLIDKLKVRGSQNDGWPYMQMAGRLYTVLLMKKIHGDNYPTLSEQVKCVNGAKLSRDLGYSEDELQFLNDFVINHKTNLDMAFSQVEQYQQKYALRNRGTGKVYETPQFTMMRMAMAVYEKFPANIRLNNVRDLYIALNNDLLNPPTPNYSALGTDHYGMASCCLIAANDDAESIKVADLITYSMTLASAGIGLHLSTRGPGDPVDNGRVDHAGRLNYLRMFVASASANKQGMRGGALNVYDQIYSPELATMANLQNPRTPVDVRERRVNITYQTNRLFHRKVAAREKFFTFTQFSAPDLHKAFFDADQTKFEELYAKYEADDSFKKTYYDAFDTLVVLLEQEIEVSTLFWNDPAEMNTHTPFLDTIIQSNLCVAPETLLLTDKGEFPIVDLVDQVVNVWNGQEWSETTVVKTGENQKLVKVTLSNGKELECTEYHKWYVEAESGGFIETRTHELTTGMVLIDFVTPAGDKVEEIYITSIVNQGRISDTYCLTEPKRHMAVFNGILTGQCMEVMVPTAAWENVTDLFDPAGDPEKGEVGICNIGSIPQHNLPFDPNDPKVGYEKVKAAVRAQMEIIAYAIDNSEYHYPAITTQAMSRRNCSVGMSGVATLFAQLNLKFNTPEGRAAWHRLNERHAYACIEVALEMGKERGNAPWMHRTKWPQGWTPIDTYKKHIDTVVDSTLFFDWTDLKARLIENKGIYFSCLIAHMPGEQATRKGKGSNSLYPLFNLSVDLSDGSSAIPWAALDNDLIGEQYQMAWDMSVEDMAIHYGICQKFTDQGISADYYIDRVAYPNPTAVQLVTWFLYRVRYGNKSKYYTRSRTFQAGAQQDIVLSDAVTLSSAVAYAATLQNNTPTISELDTMSVLDRAIAASRAALADDGLGAEAFSGCGIDGSCTN